MAKNRNSNKPEQDAEQTTEQVESVITESSSEQDAEQTTEQPPAPAVGFDEIFAAEPTLTTIYIDQSGNWHRQAFNVGGKLVVGSNVIAETITRPS
jgi:hypothetical protein